MLTPRPYQIEGRDFLASRRVALLADEMRVGKSCQAVMAAHKLGARSVRVACPAIAVPHWHREFQKWWPDEMLPRLEIGSYNKWTTEWEAGRTGNVDVFIPDEAHFAKNPDAKRTKMVYGKDGFSRHAGAVWSLSGTPAPKHAAELWPMLKAFGVVAMSYEEFITRYCVYDKWAEKIRGTKESMIPELRGLLAKVMLRRTRKDVAPEIPAIDFQFLEVEPAARVDLDGVPAKVTDEWLDDNATSLSEERIAVAQSKVIPLAKSIDFNISAGLLSQTVVFGWHTEPLEHLARVLNDLHITAELLTGKTSPVKREQIQDNFKRGLTKVVLGNILAAGTAIDLSSASHGYMIEMDWVSGNNNQAVNRLVSMEKKEPVTIDVVTVPGTIDDKVQAVLMRRVKELNQLY